MSYNKIEGYKDLVKDKKSGAILLNNPKVANEYFRKQKEVQHDTMVSEEINNIKNKLSEIDSMKSELTEIKNLLRELEIGRAHV